jgi:hypothetical protein
MAETHLLRPVSLPPRPGFARAYQWRVAGSLSTVVLSTTPGRPSAVPKAPALRFYTPRRARGASDALRVVQKPQSCESSRLDQLGACTRLGGNKLSANVLSQHVATVEVALQPFSF